MSGKSFKNFEDQFPDAPRTRKSSWLDSAPAIVLVCDFHGEFPEYDACPACEDLAE